MDKEFSAILQNAIKISTQSKAIEEYKKGYEIIKNKFDKNCNNNNYNLYNILNLLIGALKTYGYKDENIIDEIISKINKYQNQLLSNIGHEKTENNEEKIKFYKVSFDCFHSIGMVYGGILKSITNSKANTTNPYPIINKALDYFHKNEDIANAIFVLSGDIEYKSLNIESLMGIYTNRKVEKWDTILELYKKNHEETKDKTANHYWNLGWLSLNSYQYKLATEYFESQYKKLEEKEDSNRLNCLEFLLECYYSIGDYDKFKETMEKIKKDFGNSCGGLQKIFNVQKSLEKKIPRMVLEKKLQSIPLSSHTKRIKVIKSIVSSLCKEKEEEKDVYYVEEKLKYYTDLETSLEQIENFEMLNKVYEDHSCLLASQQTKEYFEKSIKLNEKIFGYFKSNKSNANYKLNLLYIIAKINISISLDSLDRHQEAIEHLLEAIIELESFIQYRKLNKKKKYIILDNVLIAVKKIARIYRKLGREEKYNFYREYKLKLNKVIENGRPKKSNQLPNPNRAYYPSQEYLRRGPTPINSQEKLSKKENINSLLKRKIEKAKESNVYSSDESLAHALKKMKEKEENNSMDSTPIKYKDTRRNLKLDSETVTIDGEEYRRSSGEPIRNIPANNEDEFVLNDDNEEEDKREKKKTKNNTSTNTTTKSNNTRQTRKKIFM